MCLTLTEKELSVLLGRVAERGVHTVVVLDCCHLGGGTRELGFRARAAPAVTTAPSAAEYVPELRELITGLRDRQVGGLTIAGRAQHVALSDWRRSAETAKPSTRAAIGMRAVGGGRARRARRPARLTTSRRRAVAVSGADPAQASANGERAKADPTPTPGPTRST